MVGSFDSWVDFPADAPVGIAQGKNDKTRISQMNLRGANYRKTMTALTPALVAHATKIKEVSGKFTPKDIAALAKEFTLPAKTSCEFLEYAGFLPSGTWERLPERTKKEIRSCHSSDDILTEKTFYP